MDETNGTDTLPTLKVTWDAEKQAVGLSFKVEEFKTWDHVAACLHAALNRAQFNSELAMMAEVHRRSQEAQNAMQIRNKLKL